MTLADRTDSEAIAPQSEGLLRRAAEILALEIDYIPNDAFSTLAEDDWEEDRRIVDETLTAAPSPPQAIADLPEHLRRMCEPKLLVAEQEVALFRTMNRFKFEADALRSQLDPTSPDHELTKSIETRLSQAQRIRDHIIQANTRLVMSIVKKFVSPLQSFDELLSDGLVTLMHAVEKFDFDRGFRFSTYAYRSIARSAYRSKTSIQQDEARFTRDAEAWAFEAEDPNSSSTLNEQLWTKLRELTASMLDRLDRREQFIISCRYALGAQREVRTFQSLADKLGVSKERVRQIEKRAVEKLQAMAREIEADELVGSAIA